MGCLLLGLWGMGGWLIVRFMGGVGEWLNVRFMGWVGGSLLGLWEV